MFDIEEELKKLPHNPGVYLMHDRSDAIIYVGKAIDLNRRVHSYFRPSKQRTLKIETMISKIDHFEYIVTDSELEALVLENNLIKEHRPKYNTLLKDDKTYPYIEVTMGEAYPRLVFSRTMKKDKSKYFGPYTSVTGVRDTIDLLNKIFQLRSCRKVLPRDIGKDRPCLNSHMKLCSAPCSGAVSEDDYKKQVEGALEFLNGHYAPVLNDLKEKMNKASENMEFEDAIFYRDLYNSVKSVAQKQKITESSEEDKDILALAVDEDDAVMQVFFVRDGKLIGREHFYMTNISESSKADITEEFIKQFYSGTPYIPKTIMLQVNITENNLVEEWLSGKKGSKVHLVVPKIGTKEKLVLLAEKNAQMVLEKDKDRIRREEGRTIGAAKELAGLIGIEKADRIEAFDISNISGFQNVGSMVVFEKGKSAKSDYRKFRIKSVDGPNDYACMKEVLTRRFLHGLEEKEQFQLKEMDEAFGSFTKFPDLLLMDGGRGQVNIAVEVLDSLGIHIPVCGMVKDDHHRTRGLYFNNVEIPIDKHSEAFKLITRVQDEAHRFAIEYHRSLRSKESLHSVLDEIKGIGPARRKALMRFFKTIDEIKQASIEELLEVPEISQIQAEEIYSFFRNNAQESSVNMED